MSADQVRFSLEEISRLIRNRLSLPPAWGQGAGELKTRASGKKAWHLSWRVQEGSKKITFWVDADALSGEIIYLHQFVQGDRTGLPPSPCCSQAEALAIAKEMLGRAHPQKSGQVELYSAVPTSRIPAGGFRFLFRRLVNGIPYPPDGFEVAVDAAARVVSEINMSWSEVAFPAPGRIIAAGEAKARFLEQFPVQLMYFIPAKPAIKSIGLNEEDEIEVRFAPFLPDGEGDREARLVYAPAFCSPFHSEPWWRIDAKTGDLIDLLGRFVDAAAIRGNLLQPAGDLTPPSPPAKEPGREDVLRRARPILAFLGAADYELVKASQKMFKRQRRAWEIHFVGDPGEIQLVFDQTSGEVLSLRNYLPEESPKAPQPFAPREGEEAARTLLKLCLPDRAARMVAADYALPADYRDALYGGYTGHFRPGVAWSRAYTFLDTVRGLPFLNNTASVIISGSAGKIESFAWNQVSGKVRFPAPEGILTPREALRRYLEAVGLELVYVCSKEKAAREKPRARLVYRLKAHPREHVAEPALFFLEAFRGKVLDAGGRYLG